MRKHRRETASLAPNEPMAIGSALMVKRIGGENFVDLAIKESFEVLPKEGPEKKGFPVPDGSLPDTIGSATLVKLVGGEKLLELAREDQFEIIIMDAAVLVKNLTGTIAVDEDLWAQSPKAQGRIT